MKIRITKIFYLLLLFAVFIPVSNITNFNIGIGYLNATKLMLYLMLLLIILLAFVNGLNSNGYALASCATVIFLFYAFASLFALGKNLSAVIRQMELYLPFIISCYLLSTFVSVNDLPYQKYLFYVVALSAATAIFLNFITGDYLVNVLSQYNDEVSQIVAAGRMQWDGAAVGLIAIFLYFNDRVLKNSGIGLFCFLIICTGILLTQNRTLIVAGILLMSYYSGLKIKNIILFLISSVVVFFVLSIIPEEALSLLKKRLFLSDVDLEIEHSFELGRIPLYLEYLDAFISSPVFGSGLGAPLSFNYFLYADVYTSDISFISFIIPFGIFGLILIFMYFLNIYSLIKSKESHERRNLYFLFFVALFVSLNMDIFSRNVFIIAFTLLVITKSIGHRNSKLRRGI